MVSTLLICLFLLLKTHSGKETSVSSWHLQFMLREYPCFSNTNLFPILFFPVMFFVKNNGWRPCLFFPTSNCFTDQTASSPITFWHGRIMKDPQKCHAASAVKSDNLGGFILVLAAKIFDTPLKLTSISALTGTGEINEICNPLCRWEGIRWFTGLEGANRHLLHILCCFNG